MGFDFGLRFRFGLRFGSFGVCSGFRFRLEVRLADWVSNNKRVRFYSATHQERQTGHQLLPQPATTTTRRPRAAVIS